MQVAVQNVKFARQIIVLSEKTTQETMVVKKCGMIAQQNVKLPIKTTVTKEKTTQRNMAVTKYGLIVQQNVRLAKHVARRIVLIIH